LRCGQLCLS